MFASAKTAKRPPAATSPTRASKPTETLPGLEEVCALEACLKAIEGVLDLKKTALKAAATERLIREGLSRKSKPDSLSLSAGKYATGNVSIRRRSTASPLAYDELESLAVLVGQNERNDEGDVVLVPGFTEILEKSPAMLAVNPAYSKDEALLKRIDKALSGVKDIPEDFILAVEAETKPVVSETALNEVFRLPPNVAEQVFALIAGVSLRAVFKDIGEAWEIVKPMLVPENNKKAA